MKTIYAHDSYNAYKEFCPAKETIERALADVTYKSFINTDSGVVWYTMDQYPITIVILPDETYATKLNTVSVSQGALSANIEMAIKAARKFKFRYYDLITSASIRIFGCELEEIEIGIDFHNLGYDEEYCSIDYDIDITILTEKHGISNETQSKMLATFCDQCFDSKGDLKDVDKIEFSYED